MKLITNYLVFFAFVFTCVSCSQGKGRSNKERDEKYPLFRTRSVNNESSSGPFFIRQNIVGSLRGIDKRQYEVAWQPVTNGLEGLFCLASKRFTVRANNRVIQIVGLEGTCEISSLDHLNQILKGDLVDANGSCSVAWIY